MAEARTRRPRPGKLATNERLRRHVEEGLKARWSPQQISARLRLDFPEDGAMRVSHETIYTSLFVQAKVGLPGELTVHLRTRRVRRRPQRRICVGPRRIADLRPLTERPAEVDGRTVIGHWEGDLIVGRGGRSHVGTLVERRSRYLVLVHLPSARTDDVIERLGVTMAALPAELRCSLTWDQGIEMVRHGVFTSETGIPVFFCEPRSPWQRGSNENTNGLVRQYLPRGTDLSVHTAGDLARVARELNARPRRTLGWRTPAEVLGDFVAIVA
jgi:IS30 family transposase